MRIYYLAGLIYFCFTISRSEAYAQEHWISGKLIDSRTSEPIAGATVTVKGSTRYAYTDMDGRFVLTVVNMDPEEEIKCACLGYKDTVLCIRGAKELGTVSLIPDDYRLSDAIVTGQTVLLRKTPVASSDVFASEIEERLGNQEFTEALKQTPGVHVNRQGGGWGDSEIFMRGFDNSNIAVMINGIPVNDMTVTVADVLPQKGSTITFEYDFEDSWRHKVRVSSVSDEPCPAEAIQLTSGKGACPPEDIGGVWGYARMLDILSGKIDAPEDKASYEEWLGLKKGEAFDAAYFDIEYANEDVEAVVDAILDGEL